MGISVSVAMILAGLLLVPTASRSEVVCEKVRPLKPVRCICGKLIDLADDPVSGVTVTVIKDGRNLATKETDADGNFIFDGMRPGRYELGARPDGFLPFRFPIVVANPEKQCKRGLLIKLELSYPDNCGSRVVGMRRIGPPKKSN
jgi:Carboxypeptidase regulatory-like domain